MADALADAAFRNFLAKGERWRKRPPIRAAENSAQDVHHNGETVAFVSAPVAIGTKRQERTSGDHVVRIGCGAALAVDGPAFGNRLAAPARNFNFSVRGGAGGHVNHDGRFFLARKGDGNGVGAEPALRTSPISIAFPGKEEPPIVVDMATSAAAYGKAM